MLFIKEDETIDTFTTKLTTLVNKAASLRHTMEDETLVHKLLNVVPDRYLQIVASVEQYSDLSEMTLEEATGRLNTYEERIKGHGRGKYKFSQGKNHENFKEERKDKEASHRSYNKNNFKKSNYDTSKLQCYKCKKIGHIAPKCPQKTKPNEQSNLVEEDLEPTLLMAILEDEEKRKVSLHKEDVGYKETNKDSLLYLGNGASNHMTRVKEHFKELDEKVTRKVRFGDDSYIKIIGKGSILIECDDEKQRIISHVYYIPDLKNNLLSLGQFTEIGSKVVMEDDVLRLYDIDNKIFMKVTRQRNRLYKANLRIGTRVCLLANLKDDTWLWHARLGHLNFESLKSMAQRNLVRGIPTIKHTSQVCDVCLIGKHSRAPFPKKAEAVRHAIHILNSILTKALEDITPYEAIKRRKPNLENLRVFGCIAYAKVPSQHLTKLDDRGTRIVYLGNEQGSKAYRLFDLTTQRICVSRNMKFKENETYDWKDYMRFRTLNDLYENTEELLLAEDEEKNYQEASSDQKWIEAMEAELDSINRNNTWKLTTLPKGRKAIGLKWVFMTKGDANGNIIKHKDRLVAKGYIQEHGLDFEEVFAPVARMKTI
nr:zinc finger, CCHC-type [Tanacetum cinerariifolium]